jgi:hypothetical protein
MKQDYLAPFLKKANIPDIRDLPAVQDMPFLQEGGGVLNQPFTYIGKKVYRNIMASKEEVLALTIKDIIRKALKISKNKQKYNEEREKQIQIDIQTIQKMTLTNKIDLEYGGGLLVFGPDFNISQMIHLFGKDNPQFFSTDVGAVMNPDVVNTNMNEAQQYSSQSIVDVIENVVYV